MRNIATAAAVKGAAIAGGVLVRFSAFDPFETVEPAGGERSSRSEPGPRAASPSIAHQARTATPYACQEGQAIADSPGINGSFVERRSL